MAYAFVLLTSFLESMVIICDNNCCHVVVVLVAWRDMCCCSFETTFAGGRLRRIARIGWLTGVIFTTVWQATRIDIPFDEHFICLLSSDLCYSADVMLMFYKLLSVHWVSLSKWSSLEHFEPCSFPPRPPVTSIVLLINSRSVNSCFPCQNLCDEKI